jgi:hypothetical protein
MLEHRNPLTIGTGPPSGKPATATTPCPASSRRLYSGTCSTRNLGPALAGFIWPSTIGRSGQRAGANNGLGRSGGPVLIPRSGDASAFHGRRAAGGNRSSTRSGLIRDPAAVRKRRPSVLDRAVFPLPPAFWRAKRCARVHAYLRVRMGQLLDMATCRKANSLKSLDNWRG